ncbi:DUF423 domain-containing protein [Ichthyenterobacterium sp. W332]|uniref:DUF423 domain-containing protein n=1 Tax=Microcosmobacter mediterraneus TaxID=3075607 RepID=A0ABU2YPN5_9FLAO|nr:DUF423 domain-containing protein [Ichthyenterobacterium sp. W332]MDT0559664.1 DUF423 domain-containing protein [Ichthyenterobacterium sp. W332]
MNKSVLITACVLGALSIILGAFAAHGLKKSISAESMSIFETGVKYQMYHALFLLCVGSSSYVIASYQKTIMYLVIIGVVFFSGSLYGLGTNNLTNFNFKKIGFITPIGGLLLIAAWITLLINFVKIKLN